MTADNRAKFEALPELPAWSRQAPTHIHYDADQMRDYALAALAGQATSEQGWLHRIDMEKTAAWQQGYAQGLHRAGQAAAQSAEPAGMRLTDEQIEVAVLAHSRAILAGRTSQTSMRRAMEAALAAAPDAASHPPQPAAAPLGDETAAARDVLAERRRQVEVEGWTTEHDDQHSDGSISVAAACYALTNVPCAKPGALSTTYLSTWVGWGGGWFKPWNRRRDLVRAGALILAEIERLDRAAAALAKD